jgi:hypothetical protein
MGKPYKPNGEEYLFIIKINKEVQAYIGTEKGLQSIKCTIIEKIKDFDPKNLNVKQYAK